MGTLMPIGRITDICSGHQCFPPTIVIQGSLDVYANDLPVHRIYDNYVPHCCGGCHPVVTAKASPTVFVNDRNTSHIGSSTFCDSGNIMVTGSFNVWIEGF